MSIFDLNDKNHIKIYPYDWLVTLDDGETDRIDSFVTFGDKIGLRRLGIVPMSRVVKVETPEGAPLDRHEIQQPVHPDGCPEFFYGSRNNIIDVVRRYVAAGLNVVPIDRKCFGGATKRPVGPWKDLQHRRLTHKELKQYFWDRHYGIGILCGKLSGNLEEIDFDDAATFDAWSESMRVNHPDLFRRLVISRSPRPGFQVWLRWNKCEGNQVIARVRFMLKDALGAPILDENGLPNFGVKTLVETRGDGGLFVAPGSPPDCHPTERPYILIQGTPETIPCLTEEEREILFAEARKFNKVFDKPKPKTQPREYTGEHQELGEDQSPYEHFNEVATWEEILSPHDWTLESGDWECGKLRRPKKEDEGFSATTGYHGLPMFYVFTTSTEFEADRGYTKAHVYAILNHDGDHHAAALDLIRQGYGSKTQHDEDCGYRQERSEFQSDEDDWDW